jgi:hypothetical protein
LLDRLEPGVWLTRGDCGEAVYGTSSIVLGWDGLSVRARQLIRSTRFVGSVVITMARFVVAVGKDGQVAFRLMGGESWLALT